VRDFLLTWRRAPLAGERLRFPLGDGDALAASLGRPAREEGRPLVVMIHGLTGCEDSLYMLRTGAMLLRAGYPVLRLNLRGAGPSRPLCRGKYHAGRTADFATVLARLPADLAAHGVAAVGYSLGGNMLLKYLGETGEDSRLRAAVTVSAPLDLRLTAEGMMRRRNGLYHRYLLARMKAECLAPPADLTEAERAAVRRSRTVEEFDAAYTAPRHGFASVDDYFERCSAKRFLAGVRTPTLVITALDDPWVPAAQYLAVDWARNPCLRPLLAKSGGHIGFQGRDRALQWHNACIAAFLERF
jgi:uncharacterized protein